MEYEKQSGYRAPTPKPLEPLLTPAQQAHQRKVFQGYVQDRVAAPARAQAQQQLVSPQQVGAFTRLAESGSAHVQRQQQRVAPILQAAELRQQDDLAVQRTQDELNTVQRSVQASGKMLSAYGLAPAGPLDVIQLQREEDRQAARVPALPLPLSPVQRQALMQHATDEIGSALTRDARYVPAAGRADVAHAAVQRYAQQGLDREALRGVMVQRAPDENTRESVTRLLTAQRRQETQAQEDKEERGLLLGHHGLQRQLQDAHAEYDGQHAQRLSERVYARQGAGQPLPNDVRRQLEQSLNADLSRVRIHDDAEADKLAKSIQAVAFTSGQDIFFRAGKYQPGTRTGFALLLHESTHTVQQARGQVKPGIDADPGLEQEAVANEGKVAMLPATSVPEMSASRTVSSGQATTGQAVQRLADPAPATPADFWFDPTWAHQFAGTLGKSRISMTLMRSGQKVTGTYQYQGHSGQLALSGNFDATNGTAQLSELDLTSPAGERGQARLMLIPTGRGAEMIGTWTGGNKQLEISLSLNDAARKPDEPKSGLVNPLFQTALIDGAMAAGIRHGLLAKSSRATVSATIPRILQECLRDQVTDPASIAVIIGNAIRESKLDPGAHEGMYYTHMEALRKAYRPYRFGGHDPASFLGRPEALANQVYAGWLGNGDVKSGDGYRYRGRGLPQTTGKANYAKLNNLNPRPMHDGAPIDFTKTPDLAADEALSIQILVQGISGGVFTSSKDTLATFLALNKPSVATFTEARRAYVGNLDTALVGKITMEIYQAIKGVPFLKPGTPGKQP